MFENPTRFTVTKGIGLSEISFMNAFDNAMIDAGIGDINLVKVSSVLPPDIEKIDTIPHDIGEFLPGVIAVSTGSGKELSAGIAYTFRKDGKGGYVAEHTANQDEIDDEKFVKDLIYKTKEMGLARKVKLEEPHLTKTKVKVKKNKYGCALTVLVYFE
ncbi:MAG: pyruvoyl-dependent arginine decarboxylase [Thermoplasmata archaeon]